MAKKTQVVQPAILDRDLIKAKIERTLAPGQAGL